MSILKANKISAELLQLREISADCLVPISDNPSNETTNKEPERQNISDSNFKDRVKSEKK